MPICTECAILMHGDDTVNHVCVAGEIPAAGDKKKRFNVGDNLQHYTAVFSGVKTMEVPFTKAFSKKPHIQVTPKDSGSIPDFKVDEENTKITLRFKSSWTGEINITVMEK